MKKKQIGTIVLALIAFTSLIQCKSTQQKELKPQLDSYFEQKVFNQANAIDEDNKPGLSVIITKKDSILYIGNFGSTDLAKTSPITENTIFDIASSSKQFTGMAIALLEEKGKIDLNDKISKYLPDLPEVMNDITVYQLIHHSSGIRDWPTLFALKGWQPEEPLSLDDIYEMLKKQESLNFTPGTEFSYSNSNYNLLAKIVEAVTDTAFNSWMQESIFAPLGMNNTYLFENSEPKEDIMANSYVYTEHNYLPFSNKLSAPGSSSLRSNTLDVSKWLTNFYSKTLGGNSSFDKMTQKGSLDNNKTIDYGYGLYITGIKNKKAYVHDGAWGGYRSGTVFFPEESIGIVILSNNGVLQPKKMITDLVDILFSQENEKESNNSELTAKEINDEFFTLCAGKYQQVDDKACYLTFFKEGEEYFCNVYGKNFKLYAKSDSVFFTKEAKVELVFHLKNGKVNSHTLKQNGKNYLALKVKESKNEININYDQLAGDYYSKELDIKYEVISENDELKIQSVIFPSDVILEHLENLTFTSNSGLMQSISFSEKDGATISLAINNPRVKKLLFKKIN
ncbi:MAG: beta-lactamase family protein [Bacteroidales bacterium]|nr:beta-lactamase family protein [Bacteroidales bacterium]